MRPTLPRAAPRREPPTCDTEPRPHQHTCLPTGWGDQLVSVPQPFDTRTLLSPRVRGCHNAEVTSQSRKPRITAAQRYWASMAAIVVVTILAAGLLGGTVSILTGARAGRSSMWGGMLAGWTLGTRVRDRKKLDLPLWHRLTEEQAATLKQYHQWSRTGRIEQDDDAKRTSAGRSGHRRSGRTGTGASKAAPSRGSSSTGAMSKRDRARAADVRRRRQGREGRSSH